MCVRARDSYTCVLCAMIATHAWGACSRCRCTIRGMRSACRRRGRSRSGTGMPAAHMIVGCVSRSSRATHSVCRGSRGCCAGVGGDTGVGGRAAHKTSAINISSPRATHTLPSLSPAPVPAGEDRHQARGTRQRQAPGIRRQAAGVITRRSSHTGHAGRTRRAGRTHRSCSIASSSSA